MSINPYESPKAQRAGNAAPNAARQTALRSVRVAFLILLAPAIYNFICFNFLSISNRLELPIHGIYRIINSLGLLTAIAAIWFFGLTALEFVASGIHAVVARASKLSDWNETLYIILRRLPFFAVAGAVLWSIWVMAFYQLQLDFYTVSIPMGIVAHALAAGLYVPLFYRWYKMERSTARKTTT